MDQVDQDRTATGLAPPRRGFKIACRFVRGPDRRDTDDVADPPLAEQRLQHLDLQMMAAVMTDQRLDAAFAHISQQRRRAFQRVGDRLLDQDMDAAPGAFDADLGMKLVRCGDDHGFRPCLVEQLMVIRKHACRRMLGCDLIDIHVSNADKIIVTPLGELSKMFPSDQPRADHADGDVLHVMRPVREWLVSSCRATGDRAGALLRHVPRRSAPASQAPAWASRR